MQEQEKLTALVGQSEEEITKAIEAKIDASDRDELVTAVRAFYKPLVRALIDSATGLYFEKIVEIKDKHGNITGRENGNVYQEKPNTDVAQYLLNQLIGKPKETQVMESRVILQRDI